MVKPLDKIKSIYKETSDCFSTKVRVVSDSSVNLARSQPTLCQRTTAVLRGLDLVLEHHGAPSLIREELDNQLHSYLDISSDEKEWLSRTKYVLTFFLSKYLRNPLPSPPSVDFKPTGSLRRWLKARCNAFNRKNTHLWYSWLQCKRCTLPLSEDFVQSSYKKHFEALTTKDPATPNVITDVQGRSFNDPDTVKAIMEMPIFVRLLDKIRKELKDNLEKTPPFTEFFPSGGACFEASRKWDGQFGQLYSEVLPNREIPKTIMKAGLEPPDVLYRLPLTTDLWSMGYFPRIYSKGKVLFNQVIEKRVPYGFELWNSMRYDTIQNELIKETRNGGKPPCTVHALLEPNKARLITKGRARLQYYNKRLQKTLHSIMRKLNCFRLMGRPFSPDDLIDLTLKAHPKDLWHSIDYSAATDNLSYRYSSSILNYIIQDIPNYDQDMATYCLGPHELHYPTVNERGEWEGIHCWGTMTNGQLMGGILSFPILCLANLGLYLLVTERIQLGWTDQERLNHVLVNGDDMLYAAPAGTITVHEYYGSLIGLDLTPDKTYVHDTYLNINSTSAHYDLKKIWTYYEEIDIDDLRYELLHSNEAVNSDNHGRSLIYEPARSRSNHTPWQINYLNAGLFFGQHKVQGEMHSESSTGDEFIPYLAEEYQYYQDDIPKDLYDKLVNLGIQGEFSDLHRILEGRSTFWNSKSLSQIKLQRLLNKGGLSDDFDNLVSSLNTVINGCLPGKSSEILSKYLKFNSDNLKRECLGIYEYHGKQRLFTRNLFIPICLGGMGIVLPSAFKTKMSAVQKAVARSCLMKLSEGKQVPLCSQRPLPGYELKKIEDLYRAPWCRRISEPVVFETRDSKLTYPLSKDRILSFAAERYSINPSSYTF